MKIRYKFFAFSSLILLIAACSNNAPGHKHTWSDPTYVWSDDYSSCTATAVCSTDETHVETERVDSVYTVVTPAGCETSGTGKYTATFTNKLFVTQTHEKTIDSTNHDYQFDSFVWTEFTAKAKYVCSHDSSHVIYHEATVTSEITEATTTTDCIKTYTATYDGHTDTKVENLGRLVYSCDPILSEDQKTVTYGVYPRHYVSDDTVIAKLNALDNPNSLGYYYYGGYYYTKCVAHFTQYFNYQFEDGVVMQRNKEYWFKCEPIVWRVLNKTDNTYLLFSDTALDVKQFHSSKENRTIDDKTIYANNYEYSDIRAWLNNDFYNTAFFLNNTPIQETTVDNSASSTFFDNENPYLTKVSNKLLFGSSIFEYL